MDCLAVFNPSRHLILSFIFVSLLLLFFSLMLSIFFPSPFLLFCQIWLQERFQLLHPPIAPFSTYLPRHLRERRLQDILGFEAYRELMGCLKETDIQWVVEWWHILSMVQSCFKDHCVTLVGLRCYSTCHISRQFGER